MAREIVVVESPGGMGDAYQCPTCSRMYPAEEGGDVPQRCRRCGSPMDLERGVEFARKLASEAASPKPAQGRRTVTV